MSNGIYGREVGKRKQEDNCFVFLLLDLLRD